MRMRIWYVVLCSCVRCGADLEFRRMTRTPKVEIQEMDRPVGELEVADSGFP